MSLFDGISDIFHGKKSPKELIDNIIKHIAILNDSNTSTEDIKLSLEKISKNLISIKVLLIGEINNDVKPETIAIMLSELLYQELFIILLQNLIKFEFEARKDVATIFSYAIKKEGYEDNDTALHCGVMLREIIKHEILCNYILVDNSDLFFRFFEFSQKSNFDVASDAFDTFKLILTKHKLLASKFLDEQYVKVFKHYNELIQSDNYVVKRQSIKLLSEILLERSNFSIMMKYITDAEHLKIMMNLLRAQSKVIQFETFHVFKIFVANPNKSPEVFDILLTNKEKLIAFLQKFKTEKDVAQFNEEKAILLQSLENLQPK